MQVSAQSYCMGLAVNPTIELAHNKLVPLPVRLSLGQTT